MITLYNEIFRLQLERIRDMYVGTSLDLQITKFPREARHQDGQWEHGRRLDPRFSEQLAGSARVDYKISPKEQRRRFNLIPFGSVKSPGVLSICNIIQGRADHD